MVTELKPPVIASTLVIFGKNMDMMHVEAENRKVHIRFLKGNI